MTTPLIPEVGILALPYHRWSTRWMTPHHVLTRLAQYFHVVWLEPAHHWREMGALRTRVAAPSEIDTILPGGFERHVPESWLPDIYRPAWAGRAMLRFRVKHGWRRLRARGCRVGVLYLWHPRFEAALEASGYELSMYHIDDEYTFSTDAPPIGEQERRVLREVDQVFAVSPLLMERKSGVNPHMTLVPEGVDFRLYSTPVAQPFDLVKVPHPRIGYTGYLKRHLDWPLLRELAQRHPQWSFVFVGARSLDREAEELVEEISRLPNVFMLGAKTVVELAAYPQHFDVCTMPYNVNNYTNNIYPLKLHEYLASGRPVVGTPIRSLLDFPGTVWLASTTEDWSAVLEAALGGQAMSAACVAARQAVAREHDWSELIYRIAKSVCEHLGPEFEQRLKRVDLGVMRTTGEH